MEKSKVLTLENISTKYGKVKMLQNLSLEVRQGEAVCLLGTNGSGKSTTIKTILGLITPYEGSIKFYNERIDGVKTHSIVEKGISIVPEGRRLFPKMSVYENIKIGFLGDIKKDKLFEENLDKVYSIFPRVKERAEQKAATLSGGEQAMLAICRGLINSPKLIILDEPSFGLAPILVENFYEALNIIKKEGITILLSEQNAGKALQFSDRGYVLQKGYLRIEGDTETLKNAPEVREAYLGG